MSTQKEAADADKQAMADLKAAAANIKQKEMLGISFKIPLRQAGKLVAVGYSSANKGSMIASRFWPLIMAASIKEMKARYDDEQLKELQALELPKGCEPNQLIALAEAAKKFPNLLMNRIKSLSAANACVLIDLIQRKVNLIETI